MGSAGKIRLVAAIRHKPGESVAAAMAGADHTGEDECARQRDRQDGDPQVPAIPPIHTGQAVQMLRPVQAGLRDQGETVLMLQEV